MELPAWIALGLTILALLGLSLSRVRPHLVMMGVLAVLSVSQILTPTEALSGFSNSGLITVAAMFVIAAGIEGSGGVDLLVNRVLGNPRTVRSALLRILVPVLFLSAFLNNTPVVAAMIPAIMVWSRRIGVAASKLMIPLSYASILGGTITLIGTSTNLVVDGQYQELTGQAGFSLFSIAPLGLAVSVVGVACMLVFFPRWLPNRDKREAFGNLREFTLEVSVDPHGPLVGKSIVDAGLRNLRRIYLVEIIRRGTVLTAVSSQQLLEGGDRLVFIGDTEAISDLLRMNGIVPSPEREDAEPLVTGRDERRLVEAVVSPHCSAVGQAIRDARFRDRYGAVVLAVARNGERVPGNLGTIRLMAGDTLLLEARPDFVSRQRHSRDFLLINDTDSAPPRHERAKLGWGILIAVVASVALGWVSMLNASLVGAALMILTGCCSTAQAEKSLDLSVLITIAASFSLGVALDKTGVAAATARHIVGLSGGQPWLMLVLVYLTVSLLTETITNNAAAILTLPIVLSLVKSQGLNPEPFVFAVMIGASASFATPLGYQTNLMVYGPGGYRFSDFLRVGVPMNLLVGVVTVTLLLSFWSLT